MGVLYAGQKEFYLIHSREKKNNHENKGNNVQEIL